MMGLWMTIGRGERTWGWGKLELCASDGWIARSDREGVCLARLDWVVLLSTPTPYEWTRVGHDAVGPVLEGCKN